MGRTGGSWRRTLSTQQSTTRRCLPDGVYLTFNSGNEVYVMKIGNRRSLERVGVFGDRPSEAAWSPTSDEFVVTSLVPPFFDEREVFIANP